MKQIQRVNSNLGLLTGAQFPSPYLNKTTIKTMRRLA